MNRRVRIPTRVVEQLESRLTEARPPGIRLTPIQLNPNDPASGAGLLGVEATRHPGTHLLCEARSSGSKNLSPWIKGNADIPVMESQLDEPLAWEPAKRKTAGRMPAPSLWRVGGRDSQQRPPHRLEIVDESLDQGRLGKRREARELLTTTRSPRFHAVSGL
jgi:hypothetical protein